MDAQEQLSRDSEISVAVLGKAKEFVLIRIDGPIDEAARATAVERGFAYCGVMGVKDGQAGVICEPFSDAAYTMMHAAIAFGAQVAERLREKPKGDSVEWLERLWQLPDPRAN
jgi:hypothetical protein